MTIEFTTYVPSSVEDLEEAPPASVAPVLVEPEAPLPQPEQDAARRPSKNDVLAVLGQGLTIFGVLVVVYVVYLFGITRLEHGRAQHGMMLRYSQMLSNQQAPIGGPIAPGTPVFVLEIPRMGLREAVVEGTNARELTHGPGHLRTSPLPGQAGNVVVAAHNVAYGGSFHDLGRLRPGDHVRAITGQTHADYVVTSVKTVGKTKRDPLSPTSDDRLTLMTSTPMLTATHRLVVTAQLRSPEVRTPAARVNEVAGNELGLQGDGSNAIALLVWAELLLVVSCATAWMYRRWSRWPTYALTLPVLALLVLLVFDSFTPLLPSTL
jgi:sortase A